MAQRPASSLTPLLMVLSLALASCSSQPLHDSTALTLTLLHINDHHSHLDSHPLLISTEGLALSALTVEGTTPEQVRLQYGGFAAIAAQFHRLSEERPNVVKLHAGDAITGTPYFTLFEGEADAAMMNEICFDFFTVGNHEFDRGDAGLAKFLNFLSAGECGTEVLGANIVPGTHSPLTGGYLKAYGVKEFDGQKVAFIGINIAHKTKTSSSPNPDTEFLDEIETAQRFIDQLSEEGIDKFVLLTHQQYANDQRLATRLSGVDVIVGGDSHSLLGDERLQELGLNPEGDYPTWAKNADGDPVCIVQAWHHGRILGELQVQFDSVGRVTHCEGQPLLPLLPTAEYDHRSEHSEADWRALPEADFAPVYQTLKRFPEVVPTRPDPSAQRRLEDFNAHVIELQEIVIGQADERLCIARLPGDAASSLCPPEETAHHGSEIATIVAQAFLEGIPEADIALQNAGGVRTDLAAGPITLSDAYRLLPFGNTLIRLDMSGAEVIAQLEQAIHYAHSEGGSSGAYPYAAGLRFHLSLSESEQPQLSEVEINSRLSGGWIKLDPEARYQLVTNSFIANGGDGYTLLEEIQRQGRGQDTEMDYAQTFIDYVQLRHEAGRALTKPRSEVYSTQSYR